MANEDDHVADGATEAILTLLAQRGTGATICPSEAARRLAPDAWRDRMSEVHAATDVLLADGRVRLSWKGEPLAARDGPYRIALAR